LQKEPKNAWAYNLRGLARERQGQLEAAIADFTEALRYDPQLAVAYNNRGIARDRSGDAKQAIADYGESIKLDPSYAAAFNNRGLARAKLGELKQAIADFDQAIRFDPKFAVALNNRGVAREQSGDPAGAEKDFTAAIAIDPKLPDSYANRGNVLRGRGKYEQAIADFEKAVRLDPRNAAAHNNLAWLRATCPDEKYRDGNAAVEAAKQACELSDWKNPDWLDSLAAAYAEAGEFEEAVKTQTSAIELAPEAQRRLKAGNGKPNMVQKRRPTPPARQQGRMSRRRRRAAPAAIQSQHAGRQALGHLGHQLSRVAYKDTAVGHFLAAGQRHFGSQERAVTETASEHP